MVRARWARVALAAVLGLACGCSSTNSCSSCSMTSRLTSLFRRDRASHEVVGTPIEGPVITDPGACDGGLGTFPPMPSAVPPLPQSAVPPLAPPPRSSTEAQRMPYQP